MPRISSQDLSSAAAHRLPRIRKAHAVAAFLFQVDRSTALRLSLELILAGLDTAMVYKEAAYTAAEILVTWQGWDSGLTDDQAFFTSSAS